VSELVQRMASMERLLVHYVGNISLDAETLRDMADTADRGGDPGTASPAAGRGKPRADEDEDEDEGSSEDYPKADITVQPLENNAARESTTDVGSWGDADHGQTILASSAIGTFPCASRTGSSNVRRHKIV
jgi:hypothetical protein